jgi:hypothetical protein
VAKFDPAKDLTLPESDKTGNRFTDAYKEQVFWIWYKAGKPSAANLMPLLPPSEQNLIPAEGTMLNWLINFRKQAVAIDEQVHLEMVEITKKERVEMLNRHAEAGKEMQETALEYLRNNKEKLGPGSAVRLWVEGLRVERESRGLPSLVAEINKTSDEDLMTMMEKLLQKGDFDNFDIELEARDLDGE